MEEGIITGGTKEEEERRGWQRERGGRQHDVEKKAKKQVKQCFLTAAIPPFTPSPHLPYPPRNLSIPLSTDPAPPPILFVLLLLCLFFFPSCEHVDGTLPLCISLSLSFPLSVRVCVQSCGRSETCIGEQACVIA